MSAPALVVLAAGASRRLGECKALVQFGGETALARLLASARALGDDALPLVVTGAHHRQIAQALAGAPVELLQNTSWELGRTGGLALAAGARPGRDLCVACVDQPLVAAGTFEALGATWIELGHPPLGWLAPRLSPAGPFGHPVLIGRKLAQELRGMPPQAPLRELRAGAEPLASVNVLDRAILDDLNTPEDLADLRAREGNRSSATDA